MSRSSAPNLHHAHDIAERLAVEHPHKIAAIRTSLTSPFGVRRSVQKIVETNFDFLTELRCGGLTIAMLSMVIDAVGYQELWGRSLKASTLASAYERAHARRSDVRTEDSRASGLNAELVSPTDSADFCSDLHASAEIGRSSQFSVEPGGSMQKLELSSAETLKSAEGRIVAPLVLSVYRPAFPHATNRTPAQDEAALTDASSASASHVTAEELNTSKTKRRGAQLLDNIGELE